MEIINPWMLYLWTRLDILCGVFGTLALILGMAAIFLLIVRVTSCGGDCRDWETTHFGTDGAGNSTVVYSYPRERSTMLGIIKYLRYTLPVFIFSLLLAVCTPSQKDMAMIYVVPKLANSVTLQQEASDIYKMAKSALQEYLPSAEDVD